MAESKTGKPDYPYTVYNFKILVENEDIGGFSECSGLTTDTDVIEYRTGIDPFLSVRKLPGLRKYTNIVLKRGFTTSDYLWVWRKKVLEPKKGEVYRRSGQIVLLGEDKEEVLRWRFYDSFPSKLEGPTLNAKNNEIAVETLELVVERLEFDNQ